VNKYSFRRKEGEKGLDLDDDDALREEHHEVTRDAQVLEHADLQHADFRDACEHLPTLNFSFLFLA